MKVFSLIGRYFYDPNAVEKHTNCYFLEGMERY